MRKGSLMVVLLFLSLMYIVQTPMPAAIKILHHFGVTAGDGDSTLGSLTKYNGALYGMTCNGGNSDYGTIFKINFDGSGYTLLHSFAGGANDGQIPNGSLIAAEGVLYGMTRQEGANGKGTIFKINTDGSGFVLLHSFAGGAGDGSYPIASLILSGSTLYGATQQGGVNDYGTIFKVNIDGNGFALLHTFSGGTTDGRSMQGSLLLSGSTLFGMTNYGGASDRGTIFQINTDGNGFALLYSFSGGDDGDTPEDSLIEANGVFYGMTWSGGASHWAGNVFKINKDGSAFTTLHSFAGATGDGSRPRGSLILSGSNLYGMTNSGGVNDLGTIFKIKTDGSGYALLHSFSGGTAGGKNPFSSLNQRKGVLYGMTFAGGSADKGIVFSLALPAADFDHDAVSDFMWRHYATTGGNCIWLMEGINGAAAGEAGVNEEEGQEITDVGAELVSAQMDAEDGRSPGSPLQDVYESALPDGADMSSEFPEQEYTGAPAAINMHENVSLPAIADLHWLMCGSGYFDSSSEQDILWRYNGTGGAVAVWLMDGTNRVSIVSLNEEPALKWQIVGVGDFNSDGNSDILWRYNGTGGKNRVWLMNGTTLLSVVNLNAQTNLTWKIAGCGDFNGDGKPDILWRFQGTGGKNQVWLMNGTTRTSIVNLKAETNLKWQIAGVGDFNKDGKPDIIWRNYATGGANRIWIMNNTTYVRTETLPAVADLNWKIEN